jgi:putative ABC transport system permease protein
MLRHIFKLVWKRKSRNMMLSLEILLAFIVVFAIAAFGVRNWQLYHTPVGFDWSDSWRVRISNGHMEGNIDKQGYEQLRNAVKELPGVDAVAFVTFAPFSGSAMRSEFAPKEGGPRVSSNMLFVSDDFFALSGVKPSVGRGFSPADDGAEVRPVVVTRGLAEELFPRADPIGKVYVTAEGSFRDAPQQFRIVGVVEHYRPQGEFQATDTHYMVARALDGATIHNLDMVVKLKPGTPRAFEEKLMARFKQVQNSWDFEVTPLEELRLSAMRASLAPLAVLAVIAGFLLVMVGFGLFGVLWQNTTRRIPEIGLRRAVGASAGSIYRQIIGEQLMLSSIAMLVGLALLVQLPLTRAMGSYLDWKIFFGAALVSMAVIYLISLLCALYPGWRASRLTPTEALHYE